MQNIKRTRLQILIVWLSICFGAARASANLPPSFAELVKKAAPGVVNITATKVIKAPAEDQMPYGLGHPFDHFFYRFFGDRTPHQFRQGGLGSGFIIDDEGMILTNNHVVEDATEIRVKLADDREFKAEIVGRDPRTDLALIRIKADGPLPILPLGDSDALEVGDWVVAIGNPFSLGNTVTSGIVSAKYRRIGAGTYDNFIQTDAPINPGNSGGPLLNMQGRVVGINSVIFSQSGGNVGIGFAIPINMVQELLPQLRMGKVQRSFLGVIIQDVTPEFKEKLQLGTGSGALVSDVIAGGPGFKAGILRGDVIISFDGKPVRSSHDLPLIVAATPIGKEVIVEIMRKDRKMRLQAETDELASEVQPSESEAETLKLGLRLQAITPEISSNYNLERTWGLLIVQVEQGSAAAEAGLQPGDIIVEADQQPMRTVAAFIRMTSQHATESALLLVDHGGHTMYRILKLF
jgi:serine protease Do